MSNGEPASSKVVMPLERHLAGGEFDFAAIVGFDFRRRALGEIGLVGGVQKALGAFVEKTGGLAVGVLEDFAAGRVGSAGGNFGGFECGGVHHGRVTAGVGEPNGIVGRDFTQSACTGKPCTFGCGALSHLD